MHCFAAILIGMLLAAQPDEKAPVLNKEEPKPNAVPPAKKADKDDNAASAPMDKLTGFSWGIVGGFLAELLGWYKLRQTAPADFPAWARSWAYWILTALMIAAGGALAVIYVASDMPLKPLLAVNIGASAPLILQSLLVPALPREPGNVD
jgi:hypothetical protein